jgi:hypothetical protein
MTTPAPQVVIRDPLTNNLLRSYTKDGDKWNWTWVTSLTAAQTFDRAEAERIIQESGQIMYRVEDPKDAFRAMSEGKPEAAPLPPFKIPAQGPQAIPLKPPAPKPMEYDLVGAEHLNQAKNDINDRLDCGWKLYGPPFMRGSQILQAMVRDKPGA